MKMIHDECQPVGDASVIDEKDHKTKAKPYPLNTTPLLGCLFDKEMPIDVSPSM